MTSDAAMRKAAARAVAMEAVSRVAVRMAAELSAVARVVAVVLTRTVGVEAATCGAGVVVTRATAVDDAAVQCIGVPLSSQSPV